MYALSSGDAEDVLGGAWGWGNLNLDTIHRRKGEERFVSQAVHVQSKRRGRE